MVFRIFRNSRKLLLIVAILALMVVSITSKADTVKADVPDAVVAAPTLNIRSGPYTSAGVVVTVEHGTQLTLTGRNQATTWVYVKVATGTSTGSVGWASLPYLSVRLTLDPKTLPVVGDGAPTNGSTGNNTQPQTQSQPQPTATAVPNSNPAPVVSGRVSGRFELGAHVGGFDGNAVAAMQRAGMTWAKFQVIAGDGGAYGLIQSVHANGLKVLFGVKGNRDQITDPNYQNQYAAYVGELAKAGADAIEVHNEMNIDREWPTGQINPVLYVQLLAKAYNAIKTNNPNTIVISGALAPTGAEGAFGLSRVWNDDRYYAGMAAAGAGKYLDCVGIHYNEGIVSPYSNSGDPRGFYPTRYFSTMLARGLASFRGKQACFTELGFLTPEGYGPLSSGFGWAANVTVAQQAAWLAQAAVKASASRRVRLMIVWNLNFTNYGEDPMAGYAMVRPGGDCPACGTLGSVMHH